MIEERDYSKQVAIGLFVIFIIIELLIFILI
jgi:hypothetical protein